LPEGLVDTKRGDGSLKLVELTNLGEEGGNEGALQVHLSGKKKFPNAGVDVENFVLKVRGVGHLFDGEGTSGPEDDFLEERGKFASRIEDTGEFEHWEMVIEPASDGIGQDGGEPAKHIAEIVKEGSSSGSESEGFSDTPCRSDRGKGTGNDSADDSNENSRDGSRAMSDGIGAFLTTPNLCGRGNFRTGEVGIDPGMDLNEGGEGDSTSSLSKLDDTKGKGGEGQEEVPLYDSDDEVVDKGNDCANSARRTSEERGEVVSSGSGSLKDRGGALENVEDGIDLRRLRRKAFFERIHHAFGSLTTVSVGHLINGSLGDGVDRRRVELRSKSRSDSTEPEEEVGERLVGHELMHVKTRDGRNWG
jgi:hypothetical protein